MKDDEKPKDFWLAWEIAESVQLFKMDSDENFVTTKFHQSELADLLLDHNALKSKLVEKDTKVDHWRALAGRMAEALELRKWHDDDCADRKEIFKPHECCECGAEAAKQAIAEFEAAKNK